MTKTKTSFVRRCTTLLASRACFRVIVGLLVLQAAWIALSGRYPMAFDEDFHLGVIRLYAHHLSPFWSRQPANADQFGAVARDPSYLYHYLMSFPYRLIAAFTNDQTIQVLILRALNIGLFAGGMALYRRVLFKLGASRALAHVSLLIFVLIPVVPLLAAQINYDNLLLPLVALTLLLGMKFEDRLVHERRLDLRTLLQLASLCLLASLVKYAFLPIFVAVVAFVAVRIWQQRRLLPAPRLGLGVAWRRLNRWTVAGLVVLLLVSSGLFVQRYGVNMVRYHTPVPGCEQVLTIKQCSQYGPWLRDYHDTQNKTTANSTKSPLIFAVDWFYGMWLRLFFAVDGPDTGFQTRGPFILPGIGAIVFAVVGIGAVGLTVPRLWRLYNTPGMWLCFGASAAYVAALWLDNYQAFLQTGQAVAINGRYLLPILLPFLMLVGFALNELFQRRAELKLALAGMAVICLLWGGGALTYILRSNDAWYWPQAVTRGANHALQRTLGPLTPGYDRPTEFMGRQ